MAMASVPDALCHMPRPDVRVKILDLVQVGGPSCAELRTLFWEIAQQVSAQNITSSPFTTEFELPYLAPGLMSGAIICSKTLAVDRRIRSLTRTLGHFKAALT